VDCGSRTERTPEGWEVDFVNKAYSAMSNAPVPYEACEYYFEVEVLEDPGATG
jgi:hypothetical protein